MGDAAALMDRLGWLGERWDWSAPCIRFPAEGLLEGVLEGPELRHLGQLLVTGGSPALRARTSHQ